MPPAIGRGGSIGSGVESSWGSSVSDTSAIGLISSSVSETIEYAADATLVEGSGGSHLSAPEVARHTAGVLVLPTSFVALGNWFDCIFGEHGSTTGSGPYVHSWPSSATAARPENCKSVTARVKYGNSVYLTEFLGVKVQKATFEWQAGQAGRLTLNVIAKSLSNFASGSPTSPTSHLHVLSRQGTTGLTWALGGGTATYSNIGRLSLEVDNRLEEVPTIGDTNTTEPMPGGDAHKVTMISARLRLTAAELDTLLATYATGEAATLAITFAGSGNFRWVISCTNAKLMECPTEVGQGGVLEVAVRWRLVDGYPSLEQRNNSANWYA